MIVNGARLVPDPSGGLFWPAESLLIVADLHFEKGSAYAERGVPLPPYDTPATLDDLAELIERHQPQTVVCLGDSFHDQRAGERLAREDVIRLKSLRAGRDWIWIAGNHDPEPPAHLGGRVLAEYRRGPLLLRHEPRPAPAPGEVAGHLHPKAAVRVRGRRMVRRCFVTDGLRLILPSFGAFTGGLDVLDAAFHALFPDAFHAHMLGRSSIHRVASRRLVQI